MRIHQKVEDPRFLYWCDRVGLLVWGEMANAYVFSPAAVEQLTREWLEVLWRDYSHPCIVTWMPINESWGVPALESDPAQQDYVRGLYHLTKALDPTRPVIGNDGWEHVVSDVWGIDDYTHSGETLRERYGTPEALQRTLRLVQPHYRSLALPDVPRQGEPVMLTDSAASTSTSIRSGRGGDMDGRKTAKRIWPDTPSSSTRYSTRRRSPVSATPSSPTPSRNQMVC